MALEESKLLLHNALLESNQEEHTTKMKCQQVTEIEDRAIEVVPSMAALNFVGQVHHERRDVCHLLPTVLRAVRQNTTTAIVHKSILYTAEDASCEKPTRYEQN